MNDFGFVLSRSIFASKLFRGSKFAQISKGKFQIVSPVILNSSMPKMQNLKHIDNVQVIVASHSNYKTFAM